MAILKSGVLENDYTGYSPYLCFAEFVIFLVFILTAIKMAQKKIVIVGDAGVGKTSLSNALCGKSFEKRYTATVGVDIQCDERCIIWDTAGQERFQPDEDAITQAYLKCDFYIVMFGSDSFTDRKISPWLEQINKSSTHEHKAKILLVVNDKSSYLPGDRRSKIGNEFRGHRVFHVNVKTGDGMKQLENVLFA
jgi:small GTP-binding protein